MLRLRSCVLTHLLSSAATYPAKYPVYSLHRLLSTVAPAAAVSPGPRFAAEEYLADTCGLTRAQALKASAKLSHLKSCANPDAVLAFLAGLGLPRADVAALVAKDPLFLCAKVEETLAPNVTGLTGVGLSHTEIARLVSLVPKSFRCRSIVSNLPYYLQLFGSYENLLRAIKHASNIPWADLENTVKPNVAFLRECGLSACDVAKMCSTLPRILTTNPERILAMVACAEGLGVPRGSGMFRQMLQAVAFLSKEKIAVRVEFLKKTFRWSDAEVSIAMSKAPVVLLKRTNELLQRKSEFLIYEVGLEPPYIARRPSMLSLSLECRLRPRYYALKFLKENGLLDCERDYFTTFAMSEKVFMEKFIYRHKEAAAHLAEDYAAACRGEGLTNFRST